LVLGGVLLLTIFSRLQAMAEELFKKRHNNNGHNALQPMSDRTGTSSALQKGRALKHFWVKK